MTPLGNKLKSLRVERGLTMEELTNSFNELYDLNLSRSSISRWENGVREPSNSNLSAYAKYFNVSLDWLLGLNADSNDDEKESLIRGVKIPVLGTIVAGLPITAVENIIDYEEIPQEMAKTGEYFALVVKGSSMEPKIYEGDVVIVKKQSTVDNGDIAIVLVNGNEATIKQIQRSQSGITLVGFNVAVYPPHIYTNEEIEDLPVNVIGKAVEVRRKL